MSDNTVHSVRTLGRPPKVWLGVRTLCISLLLTTAPIAIAKADCPASPGGANDLLISFLAANNTQSAPALLHASTVKEGMLVYDDTDNALKLCDGDNWVEVGDGGLAAHGVAGAVQFSDGAGGLLSDNANLHWDDVNKRLGVGTIQPDGRLTIRSTGNGTDPFRVDGSSGNYLFRIYDNSGSGLASVWASGGAERVRLAGNAHSFFNAPGLNLGIGTTSPASKLHVVGGIQLADDAATCPGTSDVKLGTLKYAANVLSLCNTSGWTAIDAGGIGGVTPAGNDGSIQFKSGSNLAADAANLHWDNSTKRLGIGTTAPGAKFHVYGTGTSDARIRISGSGSATNYSDLFDSGAGQLSVNSNMASGDALVDINAVPGDGTSQALVRLFRHTNTTGVRSFRILRGNNTATSDHVFYSGDSGTVAAIGINGGNVGIGTATPGAKLHVYGAGNNGGAALFEAGSWNSVTIKGVNGAGVQDSAFLKFEDASGENTFIGLTGTAGANGGNVGDLRLGVSGERVRISKTTGYVGIGNVPLPRARLHVNGGIQLADDADVCPGASNIKVGTLKYVSNVLSVCNSSGWTAIATGSGATPAGNDGSIQFKSGANFAADAANLHWDDTNNRLGIGTATPSSALHVPGGAKFGTLTATSSYAAHTVILSDGGTAFEGGLLLTNSDTSASGHSSVKLSSAFSAAAGNADFHLGVVNNDNPNTYVRTWLYGDGPTGNIGIGTTTPQSLLQVAGGIQLGDDTAACPGASNVKVGTLRYNGGALQVCGTGGWAGVSGSGGTLTDGDKTDITVSGTGTVWTIDNNAVTTAKIANSNVTNAKLANMAANTIKGNNTGSAAAPLDLTVAQLATMLDGTGTFVLKAGDTMTGRLVNTGALAASQGMATTTSNLGAFEARSQGSAGTAGAAFITFHRPSNQAVYFGLDTDNQLKVGGWSMGANAYKLWHENNDGSGSTLDADLLDGMNAVTTATANTVVARDTNGDTTVRYLMSTYLNMSHAQATRNADTIFYSSTDNYLRKNNASGFRTSLDVYSKGEVDALAGSVTDGDKGDITVSGTGAIWTIDAGAVNSAKILDGTIATADLANSAVTNAKLANMAANTVKGNNTGSAAAPIDLTMAQLRAIIGTGTPGSGNFLRGDGTWQAVPAGTVTGTGTTNYVAKFTGASAVGDSQIFDNGTNVGIGTTAPASDLEIEKTAAGGGVHTEINNLSTANHSFSQLVLRNGTGNSYAGIQNNQGTGLPYTVFFTGAGVTGGMYLDVLANAPLIFRTNAGVERMRVTAAGNVGIGTPSPGARLDVSGDGATYGLRIINTGSGDGIRLQTEDATSNNGFYWSQGATVMINMFSSVNNTIARFASGGTTAIELNTSGSSYFNGGNVGIGTDAPSHILHITGQGRSTNSAWATSSDVRVKEDIHTITGGLDTLDKMRPVTFRYTDEYQNGNAALAGLRRGFIAQEVESVVPDMVTRAVEKVGSREISDFRVLGNSDFVPLLVSAVKELKAANDNLKADNDDLRDELRETINSQDDQIEILRREIEALKAGR